ncbi:ParB/Srx family N-terminal domain-containing protein [Schaalia hyovaginalis]|uniref:ParB/Srx family N-terminal domain-containing protein n=1 Tax=Schaalia hyovaginalis TaxID=29316 RepID=UPI002A7556EB|nr:ParB/Srx family N-terminal domain-containing protein [Schaalia hyovaginalis]MDY2669802.1 ParB/Srx family N-terminal domain-containing protein [Schaalia hyovaginalis]
MDERIIVVPLEDLHLDVRNDRIGEAADEDEAAARIFEENGEHMLALAEHILTNGMNLATPLCLIPRADGGYTVVDGNRRLLTLRALADPSIVPSQQRSIRSSFERYHSQHGSAPHELRCVVYPSREDSDVWIDLIHGGQGKGEGTVSWSAEAKANRKRRRNGPKQPGHETWLWIRRTFSRDATIKEMWSAAKAKQYSFMDRLARVDRFKEVLGLTLTSDGMISSKKATGLAPAVEKLLADIAGNDINAKTLHTAEEIRSYVNEILAPLLVEQPSLDLGITVPTPTPPATASSHRLARTLPAAAEVPNPSPDDHISIPSDEDGDNGSLRYPAPTNPPTGLSDRGRLFRDVVFDAFTPKINSLGQQAQKISIDANPEACGVLCRVIIDLATLDFLIRHGGQQASLESTPLWKRIRQTLLRLDASVERNDCANRPLRDVYIACDQGNHSFAVPQLHTFVHDILKTKAASEVDHFNQLFTPMLIAMEESLCQPPRPVATSLEA